MYEIPIGMRKRRVRLGMTQDELAQECTKAGANTSQSAITRIERGERRPRPALRKALADILGYTAEGKEFPVPADPRNVRKPDPSPVSTKWLAERYLGDEWSVEQIAEEIGKSYGYTWYLLHTSGIPLRGSKDQPYKSMRKARIDKGLTLTVLAKRCGVASSTLSRVERGIHSPGRLLRLDLERELGIPYLEISAAQ